jgi:hypothetical protein
MKSKQRSKRRRSCSLDFGPENVHQSKLKHKKLKWYTWENPKPPQDACLNPKPSSHIYRDLDLQKTHQGSILAAQTELVAIHFCP